MGACQSCVLRAKSPKQVKTWQAGLSASRAEKGYFLACQAKPDDELIDIIDAEGENELPFIKATVIAKEMLSKDILYLKLNPKSRLEFEAGQFVKLGNEHGLWRSYSLASSPTAYELEFHIRLLPDGKMSHFLKSDVRIGHELNVSEALGQCCWTSHRKSKRLLLIATGTGLAPLWSILQHAQHENYAGEIDLYHGSRHLEGLYWHSKLKKLSLDWPNFHYFPCLSGVSMQDIFHGRVSELVLSNQQTLTSAEIYLCGNPDMVATMKKKCFLAGAALTKIHADPFTIGA